MTWTAKRIAEMTRLWNQGLPTSEIARRVGVSKNAVIGKIHRLGLPRRDSPIRREAAKVVEIKGPTCKWPIGDPSHEDFRYCGKAALPGKPYCAEHDSRAYIRSSARRSSHAA